MKVNKVLVLTSLGIMISILLTMSSGFQVQAKEQSYSLATTEIYNSIHRLGYNNQAKGMKIAGLINQSANLYNVEPKILVALIMVESSFRQEVVSSTGDISLAQINVKTWTKEFKRLKRSDISEKRMHSDQAYAISRMADILSILASRHKNKKDWFAYYHSSTPRHKKAYFIRVSAQLKKMIGPILVLANAD